MDKNVQATRTAIAQNRLSVAASALAERYGLADHAAALNLGNVPASVRPLYQLEATADLLDAIIASGTPASTPDEPELAAIDAITPGLADRLIAAGYDNHVALREASDDELLALDGVGKATVRKIRDIVGEPQGEPSDDAEGMEAEPE